MDNYDVPTNIYLSIYLRHYFDILLNKLNHYGIQGCSTRVHPSYLTCRMQYVKYNGHN